MHASISFGTITQPEGCNKPAYSAALKLSRRIYVGRQPEIPLEMAEKSIYFGKPKVI